MWRIVWGAVIRTKDTGRGGEQRESNGRGGSSGIKADFFLTKLIQGFLSWQCFVYSPFANSGLYNFECELLYRKEKGTELVPSLSFWMTFFITKKLLANINFFKEVIIFFPKLNKKINFSQPVGIRLAWSSLFSKYPQPIWF